MTSGTMADAQPSQSSSPSDPASSAALKHEESNGYQLAFKHTSSRESLENAIAAGNAALQISPTDDGRRSKYMAALANLYLLKYKLLELPKDLDKAMALAMQAHPVNVDAVGGDNANSAFCLNILSCVVLAEFKERARRTDRLHDVVEMARESVRLGSGDELNAPKYVGDLSWALLHRYQELGQGHDLVEAIQILEPLTLRLDRNHVNAGSCFRILGCCITPKSYLTGSKEGLSTAIKYLSEAVELTPHGFTDRPAVLANLGIAFMRRYELTNCFQDLEDAVKSDEMSTACSGSIPPSLQSQLLNNLSSAKLRLFERKGNTADLVDSIKAAKMAVSLAEPINHPNLPSYLDKVCMVLLRKFESDAIRLHHSGNGDILDRAINSGKQAVASVTQTSPSLPIFQTNLANVFLTRFEQGGSERDLDEAIDIYCAAYSKTDPTSEVYATRASNYGDALWWKFQCSGDEEVLAKSMDCAREAVSRGNKNSPDYPAYLNSLSSRLLRQFERGGSLDDLTQATDAASLAVKVSSELNHPDQRLYITTFATALWARFRQFGQLEDLELAKTILDEVIDWDREYPAKCGQLHNLANFCAARFMKLRSLSDLNEAIQHRKSTVKIATHGDPKRPLYLHGLTTDLHTRAAYIGSTADWNEAKACIEEAVELTPDKDVRRTMYLDSQAGIVLLLHDAYELATIDRAITLFKTAQESGNEKFKGQILANLALARHMRFRFSKSLGDLDLAEQSIRRSLNETGVSLEHIVKRQKCHASILLSRANASNSKNDVNEAIDILTKVVNNTSAIDGNRGFYLTALGEALYTRDGPGDKNSAAKLYTAAAGLENLNPAMRVISAKVAARLLSDTDPIKAQSLLAMAVRIMPELAPHQGDRSAAQKKVAAMYGTASDAAAFTLDCGFTSELAVALLDFGRFIIMGRILETRVDLKDLPNSLRREYEMLQNALDDGMEEIGFGLSDSEKREVRHCNAVSFEKLRVKIREIEGFHNFGLPYEEKDLVSDAAEGPIVVLNINARRSDALLITNGGVIQLPLDISPASVEEMSSKLHVALETIQKTSSSVNDKSSASEELEASANILIQQLETQISTVLEWLWDSIAEPVLIKLGYTSPCPANEECPRIWWCPSGRLSSLPLHAAGYHNDPSSCRTVLDRVVSTYTSTVRMLQYSRAQKIHLSTQNVAIAAMPRTPRQGGLRMRKLDRARDEALKVKLFTTKFGNTVISEEKVTVERLQEMLSDASIAHLACHAIYVPKDPSSSRLLLQDGGLSVSRIAQWNLRNGALAYLSACSTAFTGASVWDDEAITLASAFQVAGFSHVVGTLWIAEDITSFAVAQSFYEFLQNDLSRAAFALHAAVVQQRTLALSEPSKWAAFIYNGA